MPHLKLNGVPSNSVGAIFAIKSAHEVLSLNNETFDRPQTLEYSKPSQLIAFKWPLASKKKEFPSHIKECKKGRCVNFPGEPPPIHCTQMLKRLQTKHTSNRSHFLAPASRSDDSQPERQTPLK